VTVSEATAQMFDPADPDRPVKAFLQEYQTLFGFGPEALDDPAMAALVQSGADLPLSSPPAIAAAVTCARQFEFGLITHIQMRLIFVDAIFYDTQQVAIQNTIGSFSLPHCEQRERSTSASSV
jgi:hypothetical protein